MTTGLRVLYATPEIAPWVKSGGLGDVAQSLSTALQALGVDLRVLVPAYPALLDAFPDARPAAEISPPGGRLPAARLRLATRAPHLYLLDCPVCYARDGNPYLGPDGCDWPDNDIRFGLLSRVAALIGSAANPLAWSPQIVHCNDWQTGLAPAWLACERAPAAASVMTIHNLAYQGLFPPQSLATLGLPSELWRLDGVEFHGQLSFLKAGLQFADWLNTVSPTYAHEIQQPALGFGMDGLLRHRTGRLRGILNGIDLETWDPARDAALASPYGPDDLSGKARCKSALQQELGLAVAPRRPLLGMVARLVEQKGADLVLQSAPMLIARGAQLAVLGSGDSGLERALRTLATEHAGSAAVRIGFDEHLAHRIEAGADIFLMPSRFEPCGLNQFYSMRYGTVPVVRRTGGLADSVVDADDPGSGRPATGFVFDAASQRAFLGAVMRALEAYADDARWMRLVRQGMQGDYGWSGSARQYLALYRDAVAARRA